MPDTDRQFEDTLDTADTQLAELEYANQLALERREGIESASTIQEEGRSFGRPSLIKYFLLFFVLAIPNDAIDTLELTGFMAMVAWFASMFLSITTILVMWFTDQEQKRAEGFMKKIEEYKRTAIRTTRTAFKIARLFKRSPTVKIVMGAIAELIPLLSIFPWATIAVLLAYLDERKSYKEAQKSGEEVSSAILTEAEAI